MDFRINFRSVFRELSEAGLKSVRYELTKDVAWLIKLVFVQGYDNMIYHNLFCDINFVKN